jgi:3-phosphoinositide dependent protein kinase-1
MVPVILDLLSRSENDKAAERLKQVDHEYRSFVEDRLILKQGVLEKKRRAHYPVRKRMFLLTEGPRLIYVDPDKKEIKGEVPWSANMTTKFLNFKKFEIHTPNRTYDLLDTSGGAIDWCQCIDAVRDRYFPPVNHVKATPPSSQ